MYVFTAVASVVIAISVATVLTILGIIVIAVCVVRFKQKVTSKSLYNKLIIYRPTTFY